MPYMYRKITNIKSNKNYSKIHQPIYYCFSWNPQRPLAEPQGSGGFRSMADSSRFSSRILLHFAPSLLFHSYCRHIAPVENNEEKRIIIETYSTSDLSAQSDGRRIYRPSRTDDGFIGLVQTSVSQPGFPGTLGFRKRTLGVPRETVINRLMYF